MGILKKIREFFWPVLEPYTAEQEKNIKERMENFGEYETVKEKIDYIKGKDVAIIFLNITQQVYNEEKERLKVVENKSITLFSASGLIIALIANFIDKLFIFPYRSFSIILTLFLILTFSYFLTCIFYSIKVLEREGYYQLDIKDIINNKLTDEEGYYKTIGSKYCSYITKNEKIINKKVDFMTMAQDFFKHGIVLAVIITIILCIFKILI